MMKAQGSIGWFHQRRVFEMIDDIKKAVKKRYKKIAVGSGCRCSSSCCDSDNYAEKVGYSKDELSKVPEGSNLGLGCGNPTALASLAKGEIVLDLGSGAGFDAFLAAQRVGESGKVIGVDMTEEMIEKARKNAEKGHYSNVEFRLGEIEHLPVDNSSVDVIISNCVINLSPDKKKVYNEAFRVLRPGGRIMVSDIVTAGELPDDVKQNLEAWSSCISGALKREDYLRTIRMAGFSEMEIISEKVMSWKELNEDMVGQVISLSVVAHKPRE